MNTNEHEFFFEAGWCDTKTSVTDSEKGSGLSNKHFPGDDVLA
jgi:hypothetical protein